MKSNQFKMCPHSPKPGGVTALTFTLAASAGVDSTPKDFDALVRRAYRNITEPFDGWSASTNDKAQYEAGLRTFAQDSTVTTEKSRFDFIRGMFNALGQQSERIADDCDDTRAIRADAKAGTLTYAYLCCAGDPTKLETLGFTVAVGGTSLEVGLTLEKLEQAHALRSINVLTKGLRLMDIGADALEATVGLAECALKNPAFRSKKTQLENHIATIKALTPVR